MLSAVLGVVVALFVIWVTGLIYKWRNPICKNGVLPPGSMGLPIIGESLSLIIPSNSLDLHPFIKKRIKKWLSNCIRDAEFNYFMLQQDGKLVERWYLDAFAKLFAQSEEHSSKIQKYLRNTVLHWCGMESLKEKWLPQFEELVCKTLNNWSSQETIEVKSEAATVTTDFGAKLLFSYDPENSQEKLGDLFKDLIEGLMSFPLNIPGTTYYKCLKNRKKVVEMMRAEINKRSMSPYTRYGDVLEQIIQDQNNESFLTEDCIIQSMFSLIYVFADSISTTLALAIKLLAEDPLTLQELIAEHEAILKNRENPNSQITWSEYKSMIFTRQVINETLRLANITPGLFRKATKDIQFKGYTIPIGWPILIASPAVHLNSNTYEDPLIFNPWRWKGLQSTFVNKNFMPFGFGCKQCAGADYTKVFLSTFLHILVTKYRWTKVKEIKIIRSPTIKFPDGFHFKIVAKDDILK